MTDRPILRLARVLREAEEVCQDQICALASDWTAPAMLEAKKAKEFLQEARLHAGACLGLLILAEDPDAFTLAGATPTPAHAFAVGDPLWAGGTRCGVVSAFVALDAHPRYVVEDAKGQLYIFREEALSPRDIVTEVPK